MSYNIQKRKKTNYGRIQKNSYLNMYNIYYVVEVVLANDIYVT